MAFDTNTIKSNIQNGYAATVDFLREHSMQFITGIHFSKSALRELLGMTFLLNPSWEAGQSDYPTLPVAFFNIKDFSEIMQTQVSHKPMLFYNSQRTGSNDGTNGSLLNVVADNIVIQPKEYRLECFVPAANLTQLQNSYLMNPNQIGNIMTTVTTSQTSRSNIYMQYLSTFFGATTQWLSIIESVLKYFKSADETESLIAGVTTTPEYNIHSLEEMWRTRTILKLKLWNSWKYKYVVITNLELKKDGTQEGVYNAAMTLQEVPILTVRNNIGNDIKTSNWENKTLKARGKLLMDTFNKWEQ